MEKLELQDIPFNSYPQGKLKVLFRYDHRPVLTLGPHWMVFIISWVTIFTGFLLELLYKIIYQHKIFISIWLFVTITFLLSYLLVALIDPGIAKRSSEGLRECKFCKSMKKKGTIHCLDCQVCIQEYDHHCPWIGKCIGRGNIIMFKIFLVFYGLFFLVIIVGVVL